MAHSRNLVPSKDALRALRSLALSPHTALVGTVGSVCGLVAVNHHQRRKVQLAEQILETKRTIQTLSGGRGNLQATRMFEAAERGDDFTLHHGRPRKPRRSRRYSAAAGQMEKDDTSAVNSKSNGLEDTILDAEFQPFTSTDASPTDVPDDSTEWRPFNKTVVRNSRMQTLGLETPAAESDRFKRPDPAQTNDAKDLRPESSASDRFITKSDRSSESGYVYRIHIKPIEQKTTQDHGALPRLTEDKKQETSRRVQSNWAKFSLNARENKWTTKLTEAAQERLRKRWQPLLKQHIVPVAESSAEHLTQQVPTDLSPIPSKNSKPLPENGIDVLPGLSPEESVFFNFVFGKPSPDNVFQSSFFQALYKSDMELNDVDQVLSKQADNVESQTIEPAPSGDQSHIRPAIAVPYVNYDQVVPATLHPSSPALESQYHSSWSSFDSVKDFERYLYIYNTLVCCLEQEGSSSCLKLFEATYEAYASTERDDGFKMLKILSKDLCRHFQNKEFSQTIRRSVRRVLNEEDPNLLVVESLYSDDFSVKKQVASRKYLQARLYLEEHAREVPDHDQQLSELRKILDGMNRVGIPLDEQLLVPVLRHLCAGGKVLEAQSVVDEIAKTYNIHLSYYSLSIVMKGYAAAGMWPKVKAMMDDCHANDLSWKKFYGFASMFGEAIPQYAENYSPERLYAFVLYAIKEYSLFPTSKISNRLLCVFLRERRYDLVKKWIEMIQADFPMLDLGIGNQEFALEVGEVWQEIEASCEEVLYSCRALSTNAIRDPFSKLFRSTASEVTMKDLSRRIAELESAGIHKLPMRRKIEDVRSLMYDIHQLIRNTFQNGFTVRTRLMAQDLVQQTKAVVNLDLLFSGSYGVQTRGQPKDEHLSHTHDTAQNQPRMPHGLRTTRLPKLEGIIVIMKKHYESCIQKDLPIEHSTLQTLIERLIKVDRLSDAYAVIEFVYEGCWDSSALWKPFDITIFTIWLKVARDLRSDTKIRAVLWAIADAGPELQLSSEILLLARLAAPDVTLSKFRNANLYIVSEVEYLRQRLARRKALQGDGQINYARWKRFGDYTGSRHRAQMKLDQDIEWRSLSWQ